MNIRLILLFFSTVGYALRIGNKINHGKLALSNDANLYYLVDMVDGIIAFNLTVQNKTGLNKLTERAWLSLGISEPNSGGVLGADLVTVEFAANIFDACTILDRYVPFTAYPYDIGLPKSKVFSVVEDKCQDDPSWELLHCNRDVTTGTINMEVRRSIGAHDYQDRSINKGKQHVIFAYGTGSHVYANGVKGGRHVVLYDEDGKVPEQSYPILPGDVWGNQTIKTTGYNVPKKEATNYVCTSIAADVPVGGNLSIVALEPVTDTKQSSTTKVHSMTLYACAFFPGFPHLRTTQPCGSRRGEFPNPSTFCKDLLFTWANGVDRFVLPEGVGFMLNEENKYLVLETIYHDPTRKGGRVDTSGVRLHYSKNPRRHAAGTLLLGDSLLSLKDGLVKNAPGNKVASSCSTACTQYFSDSVTLFASSPRMHFTGRSVSTHKYTSTGAYVETINRIEYWSAEQQTTNMLASPVTLLPGEQLGTTCKYDISKLPNTKFGVLLSEELCQDFVFYYPKQDFSHVSGFPVLPAGGSLAYCGMSSGGEPNATICGFKVLSQPNNPLDDTLAGNNMFGAAPDVCPAKPEETPLIAPRKGQNNVTCFPAHAQVRLRNGDLVRIDEVNLGEEVAAGNDAYSRVIGFTHRDGFRVHQFVAIQLGSTILEVSAGHMVYANGKLVPASSVRVGDTMQKENGDIAKVEGLKMVRRNGLYNVQTMSGNIVVNGVQVSTYTTGIPSNMAHAALAPLRALSARLGFDMLLLQYGWDSLP